ncbi:MAG: Calx-beta domain-containing protein, partial [Brevundimonas sp.]
MTAVVHSLMAKARQAASVLLLVALAVFFAPSLAIAQTPLLSIDSVDKVEGDSGVTNFVFTVSLSAGTFNTVMVNYATSDMSATTADGDYVATSGTLTFAPMLTTQQVIVPVNGDLKVEPDELFILTLSGATSANIDRP